MIGIIGAMELEVAGLIDAMEDTSEAVVCGQRLTTGTLCGVPVTVAKCGAGKVNAAMCATVLLLTAKPKLLLSTGVAGGIGKGVQIGDLVIACHSVQYDYDTTAIGEPPAAVTIDGKLVTKLPASAPHSAVLEKYAAEIYGGVHVGAIATGDRFVADGAFCASLRERFGAVACEMETASIAHVAAANNTPFCGLRAVSDNADESGKVDFQAFAVDSAKKCIALLTEAVGALDAV